MIEHPDLPPDPWGVDLTVKKENVDQALANGRVQRLINDLAHCEPHLLGVLTDLILGDEDRFLLCLEEALTHGSTERVRRVGEVVARVLQDREFVRRRAQGGR